MGWKILLTQDIRPEGKNYLLDRGHQFVMGNGNDTLNLIKAVKDVDAVITKSGLIGREVLNAANQLKVVACLGDGYESVDLKTAGERGIHVINCPEADIISTVETTVFYMLHCSRQFLKVRRDFIDDYQRARQSDEKQELWGKTLGIIGCGRIGGRVAKICRESFHMKVQAYDPYKPAADFPEGVRVVRNLDDLLAGSDFVSLHMFPRREKKYRLGMEQFRKMKPTSYLINTSSGLLVDEEALYQACKDHVIAGAALDGLVQMPADKRNPILYMDNILISPNIGSSTREADTRTALQAAMGIQEIYEGKEASFEVKEKDWKHMPVYHDTRNFEREDVSGTGQV